MGPKQAICAVRCASQKIAFAMRCIFTAICTLVAEIRCDVGHDASITAIAMRDMVDMVNLVLNLGRNSPCKRGLILHTKGVKVLYIAAAAAAAVFAPTSFS